MANPSKKKGTAEEGRWAEWFRGWWPSADRSALRGSKDIGDLYGVPFNVSVKRCESWPVHRWIKELDKMCANRPVPGFIIARRSREKAVVIMPIDTLEHLLDGLYGRRRVHPTDAGGAG